MGVPGSHDDRPSQPHDQVFTRGGPSPRLAARVEPDADRIAAAETRMLARLRGELEPKAHETTQRERRVGRYTLLERLGAGAAGTVHAAFDPELGRHVAIKLLHTAGDDPRHHERLRREAHALARLSHPNVVHVYEIGPHEDGVFLAMELVRGRNLRQWIADAPRSFAEVLDIYLRVGEGLVAAHAVGLVHRDFKPDNVLVADDGRPRVADFGLARPEHGSSFATATTGPDQATETPLGNLTATGAIVGTPAYMAPEQARGEPVTPAADQFSYCVSLYEGLFGERPFEAWERFDSPEVPAIRPAPTSSVVPRWLREVLLRGLRSAPVERWPSMRALLAALRRDPVAARRRRWLRGAAVLLVGATAYGAYWIGSVPRDRCEDEADERVAEIWNPSQGRAVETAVLQSGVGYAPQTWARLQPRLDEYAGHLQRAYRAACVRPSVAAAAAPTVAAASSPTCLEARRRDLRSLVEVLRSADATVVEHAVQAAEALPSIEECGQPGSSFVPPSDPEHEERVELVRQKIVRARALQLAGKYEQGREAAEAARRAALELGDAAPLAEARLRQAALTLELGEHARSESLLEDAFFGARAVGHDAVARDAARLLAQTVGVHLHRHEEGLRWASHACADAERVGHALAIAACEEVRGNVLYAKGEWAAAEDHHRRALADHERLLGRDHLQVAQSLHNLGSSLFRQGRYDEARDAYTRALEILKTALGDEHPEVATTLARLGSIALDRGDYDEAETVMTRALALRERALGRAHPDVASIVLNLAIVHEHRGEVDAARAHYERTTAVWMEAFGPEHPDLALARFNLGNLLARQGHFEQARVEYERALAIWEPQLGPEHPHVAVLLSSLGNLALEQGELDTALTHYRRALEIRERTLGPDSPRLGHTLNNFGEALAEKGELAEAERVHERALELRERSLGPDHVDVAQSLVGLAELQRRRGRCELASSGFRQALEIIERSFEPEHIELITPLLGLARCALAEGDAAVALAYGVRAEQIGLAHAIALDQLAEARFVQAQALWADPDRRERALALARGARDAWAEQGAGREARHRAAVAWLRAHGEPSPR